MLSGHRPDVVSQSVQAAGRAARSARDSTVVRRGARAGLVARGVFYLLLAYLTAQILVNGGSAQVDPNGALRTIAGQPFGQVALAIAAVGLLVFALIRLVVAVSTYLAEHEWLPSLRAAGEAVMYAALGIGTVLFLVGDQTQGSEQSHREFTARLLDAPAGRIAVAAVGLAVIGFYFYQFGVAVTQGFESDIDESRMPPPLQKVAAITGTTGITARVIAFMPIGVFLVIAAVTHKAGEAKGLDGALRDAAGHPWGQVLLVIVALGFAAFAVFSFLEAGYRKVDSA